MKTSTFALTTACFALSLGLAQAEPATLNPHLEPLRPLLDKTWKGVFNGSKPEKPTVDVAKWERALNGQAIRMLHSVNDGVYGGETLFLWDAKKSSIVYYYFTTAGYMTTGTLEMKDGKMITFEEVQGEAGGVSAVRAANEFLPNGKFHVKAEYCKNGEWMLGHEVTYEPDSSAKPVFK